MDVQKKMGSISTSASSHIRVVEEQLSHHNDSSPASRVATQWAIQLR